ncbi:MAG: hypothetical protein ACRDV9_11245 [Acidimicrobiia bacterium]
MSTARFRMTGQRTRVLRALARGPVEDRTGRAVQRLAATTHPSSQESLALALVRLERLELVRREVRGKRTYRIEITPEGDQALRLATPSAAHRVSVERLPLDSLPAGPARSWPTPSSTREIPAADAPGQTLADEANVEKPTEPTPAPGAPIDYEVLAGVLLKKALAAIEAEAANSAAAEELRKANSAEEAARRRVAGLERELAEAKRRLFELDANLRVTEADNAVLTARFERTSGRAALKNTISDRQAESLDILHRDLERRTADQPGSRTTGS